MKLVNYVYDSILFNIDFQNKINLLVSDSGTGKTFLLRALKYYCDDNDIPSTHVDYIHRSMILNGEVLLFDRADLYFTHELFEKLKELNAISIISIHHTEDLDLFGDIGIYRLINTGSEIVSKRFG